MLVRTEFSAGAGLIVTTTLKGVPAQLPDNGVTLYVAVWMVLVTLVSSPLIFAEPLPGVPPVKPVPAGADQL